MNLAFLKAWMTPLMVIVIGLSLLFCCSASWQMVMASGDPMSSMPGCDMAGGLTGKTEMADHNQMTQAVLINLFKIFALAVVAWLVSLWAVDFKKFIDNLKNYFKSIRDRYGGFVIFNNFIILFKIGILNPKVI